jgi:hypothetical protein
MSLFTGKGRVHQYEQVRDLSHVETLTMRSLTLTGAAMLAAALLTGCGADSGPTAETASGLTADATDHNTADHFNYVQAANFEFESPCNGELITFVGEDDIQVTKVASREILDQGLYLHYELLIQTRASGTGSETGAIYTLHDIYREGFDSPNPPALQATVRAGDVSHITSSLPGLSFDTHFLFHVVALPSDEFKVTKEVESVVCKS